MSADWATFAVALLGWRGPYRSLCSVSDSPTGQRGWNSICRGGRARRNVRRPVSHGPGLMWTRVQTIEMAREYLM